MQKAVKLKIFTTIIHQSTQINNPPIMRGAERIKEKYLLKDSKWYYASNVPFTRTVPFSTILRPMANTVFRL